MQTSEGQPYLKIFVITNIAWNKEFLAFYNEKAPQGMEFYNLRTLLGQVMLTKQSQGSKLFNLPPTIHRLN